MTMTAADFRVHNDEIWEEVKAERLRAHEKHGDTSMESADPADPEGVRRDIIIEKVGEISREYNEARHARRPVDLARVREELIQLAAMAAAWADAIDVEDDGGPVRVGRCEFGCACNCGLPVCGCHDSARALEAREDEIARGGV